MGAALGAAGDGASGPPREADVAAELVGLLAQRPASALPLADLDALLSAPLQQLAQERGGLAAWLRGFPEHFVVAEGAAADSVSLSPAALLRLNQAGTDDDCALTPPQTPRDTGDIITPLKATPGGKAQAALARGPDDAAVCPGADAAAWPSGGPPLDDPADGRLALQLRGLPYRATVEDIRAFLGDFASALADEDPIHLVLNRDGRPSGFARVLFQTAEAALQCRDQTHLRSMQDRYVEVFLYSDRPRARNRRGGDDSADSTPLKDGGGLDSASAREQVMRECREVMADPRHGPRMLLSTLGAELSPSARACVKQIDNGLKHFLAQHPGEFSVDGAKGCEHVTYSPPCWRPRDAPRPREPLGVPLQLSEVLSFSPAPPPPAPTTAELPWEPAPPCSPPPPGSPPPKPASRFQAAQPTPKSALVPPTPSSLGFPHETPSRYPSPYQDSTQWQPQSAVPPWPGAPAMPPPLPGMTLPSAAATGTAGADGFLGGFSDGAAFAAMASAMASAMAAPWAPAPAWPMPTPPFLPGFVPTAQAPWGAVVPEAAPQAGGAAAAEAGPEAGAAGEGRAECRIWPGQASPDGEAALGSAVRLRGLPFSSTEQEVLAFFAQYGASDRIAAGPSPVSLIMRANGRPSGQAVVQMHSRADAAAAQRLLDSKYMGNRYIEVFLHVEGDLGPGAAGGEGAGRGAQRPASGARAPEAPAGAQPHASQAASAQTAMAVAMDTAPAAAVAVCGDGQPVQGQVMGLHDFSAPFKMPQWPMDAWGAMPPMGACATMPGIAAEPAVGSDWSTLFASLSGSPDAAHLCPPLPLGEAVPPSGPLAEAAAA